MNEHDEGELAREARALQAVLLEGPEDLASLNIKGRALGAPQCAGRALDTHHLVPAVLAVDTARRDNTGADWGFRDTNRSGQAEGPLHCLWRDGAVDEMRGVHQKVRVPGGTSVNECRLGILRAGLDGNADSGRLKAVRQSVRRVEDEAQG